MRKLYPALAILALSALSCRKEYSGWNVYYNSKINLIETEPSEDCPNGGIMIQSGLDKNQNEILDSSEIDQTEVVCNGATGANGEGGSGSNDPDKQIVIPLNMMTANTGSSTPIVVGSYPFFSKLNYPGVDSIVFVGQPYINPQETNSVIVELYDLTNNRPIANSAISSNQGLGGFTVSKNIYSSLPDEEITLGISIRSEHEGMFAGIYTLYLYMYRR